MGAGVEREIGGIAGLESLNLREPVRDLAVR